MLILYLTEEFGVPDLEAGVCYGVLGALTSIYGFAAGYVIDNLDVKLSLTIGNAVMLAARLILAFATTKWIVYATLFTIMPFGNAFGIPVLQIAVRRCTFVSYSDGRPGNSKVRARVRVRAMARAFVRPCMRAWVFG